MAVSFPKMWLLSEALRAEGFQLPKHVGDLRLELPVDGSPILYYTQILDAEDTAKLGRALARMNGQGTVASGKNVGADVFWDRGNNT